MSIRTHQQERRACSPVRSLSRVIIRAAGLAPSTYYYRREPSARARGGRRDSAQTAKSDGSLAENSVVLAAVERVLGGEFVCYGHRAMAAELRREGFCINHKKLYRLMKNADLLANRRAAHRNKRSLAPRGRVVAVRPWQHLQMDIRLASVRLHPRRATLGILAHGH